MNTQFQRLAHHPVSQFDIYQWAREHRRQWFVRMRANVVARCTTSLAHLRMPAPVWPCLLVFVAATGASLAAGPKLAAVCAERDIAAITLIEERASSETVPSESLYQAFGTQVQARIACAAGQVGEAMTLYDRIEHEVRTAGSGTTTR